MRFPVLLQANLLRVVSDFEQPSNRAVRWSDILYYILYFFSSLDIWSILPSPVFLIVIIDPFGNMLITINMEQRPAHSLRLWP